MTHSEVAALLDETADILDILGENPFKSRAHRAAARVIETLSGNLYNLVASGELLEVKGIGQGLFHKIKTLLETGSFPPEDDVKSRLPEGLLDLLRIPGMGPKKVKAVYERLNIKNIGELEYACSENRLSELDGFGAKSQEKILQGIRNLKKYRERSLLSTAMAGAEVILSALSVHPDVEKILLAGSLRRFRETIKDIDILVSARKSEAVMEAFTSLPEAESVIAGGPTKSSITLKSGLNVDLRVVGNKEFPFASHYFTGSKEHNTELRGRAKKMGLKLNEYGLFEGDRPLPCRDEAAIFERLGLAFIPPELRENTGEIEAAESGTLPELIEERDLRGLFHVHSNYSDGVNTLDEMARAAMELGFEYLGIADHSQSAGYAGGLTPAAVVKQHREIDALNETYEGFTLFHGIESDILPDGSLDYDEDILKQFDFVIASVHSGFNMSEAQMTARIVKAVANPYTTMLGHPTGRLLLAREGYPVNIGAVIEAAREHQVIIELNAHPQRLDLDWRHLKTARDKGVLIAINPDSHKTQGLTDYWYGVGIARKGWLSKQDVVNTRDTGQLISLFKALQSRKKR
jgi:DNA polymerase (family 10)